MRAIAVHTPSASYRVHVGTGLLPSLRRHTHNAARGQLVFVLTTQAVWALWGQRLLSTLPAQPLVLFLPEGERAKNLREITRLAEELAHAGADRASLLIAFGGGIVGDMGGFLAAIYMRGIQYVQVPTTLLAQVDSSVGGKTGANLQAGKNLVGAFHHPQAVYADVDLLATLPENELRAGLMESVKAGILRDPKLFALIEENALAIRPDAAGLLTEVVARSVAMKAKIVAEDERESGLRMILNLGHTIGHAIEAVTRYRVLLHGEAVGWGMLVALHIARQRGVMRELDVERAAALIRTVGQLPRFTAKAAALLDASGRDKKNSGGKRRFVLPTGIGNAVVVDDVSDAELLAATNTMLQEARHA